jgi:hypothetical protein
MGRDPAECKREFPPDEMQEDQKEGKIMDGKIIFLRKERSARALNADAG